MITDKTEELMWQKIDGTISSQDEDRLEALIEGDAEVREHYEELTKFSEILGAVEEIEPPAALRQRIEGAIDWGRFAARQPLPARVSRRRWFPARWDFRLAFSAAAGFLIGITSYHLIAYNSNVNGPLDNSKLYGTIGRTDNGFAIDLEAVQGTIRFRQQGDLAVSELDLTSHRTVEVLLEYGGESVEFGAVGDIDDPLQSISIAGNKIVLNNLGSGRYFAVFRRDEGPLRVQILSDGVLLFDQDVSPGDRR